MEIEGFYEEEKGLRFNAGPGQSKDATAWALI